MIHGVAVKELKLIPDERGFLMEILRADDAIYDRFGQAYVTAAYPGVVKAWHYHRLQTDHFCVLNGMAKVVLYDSRDDSPTKGEINEFYIGEQRRQVIKIPNFVYHGYKNIGTDVCLLLNIPTETYNYSEPDEYRIDPHSGEIPYDWNRRDG
ncbi:MAG: dTDP-4-dehydrorhamnose 3,5-epimerase family protein [Planctomycetales bacterium]|nr:dTDP-4-dehydrorhamnose 3,5-epimerase family protein [bacterium]UNM08126.1 MAG: dTDP-4-dehydrorhamnose 3,5-epimerase family protein [Planctomycetales bacterium]